MRTEKDLCTEALAVQDACNLSGVVHSYSRALTDLWEIAHQEQRRGDIVSAAKWVNEHCVTILYADKIAQLTYLATTYVVPAAFRAAFDIVKDDHGTDEVDSRA